MSLSKEQMVHTKIQPARNKLLMNSGGLAMMGS